MNTALFASMDEDQILTVLENTGNQTADGYDIYARKPVNNGDMNQYGVEIDLVYNPVNALRLRALLSPYYFEIINTTNAAYDTEDFVLYGNAIADYKFLETWKFQINYTYQSPKTTGLTELKAIQFVNLALSKDLFKSKASLTFTAKDVFSSRKIYYESMEAGIQTNSYAFFDPQLLLSFSYRFNGAAKRNSKNRSGEVNKNIFELDDNLIK
ncbi:MAG: outer membrane beta-barrel protein [Flavobacteriaceae bacterium]|nr:outer membrane beta-barrel protein [Flavobacteriaceae bacterium]